MSRPGIERAAGELAAAAVVAVGCLAANWLAVAFVPPLSIDNLGPLALVFHPTRPSLLLLPLLALLGLRARAFGPVARRVLPVFAGAACANVLSSRLWSHGVPDYLVLREMDVAMNLSDLLIVGSTAVLVGDFLGEAWRRRRRAPFGRAG